MSPTLLDRAPGRLDPIGAAAAWSIAPVAGTIAVVYAIVRSVTNSGEIVHPDLAVVAVGLLAAAAATLAVAAHPNVAHLDRSTAVFATALATLAAILSAASTWGHNRLVQDDWGQIGVALLIFGMLWLRPPLDLIVLGALGALVVGVLAAEQTGTLHIINTPYVYAVVAATPVLVLSAVGATSGAVVNRFATEWSRSAREGMAGLGPELRVIEEDALHRAQLDELRHMTLPLLASVAENGEITEVDIDAAARASAELRERALEQVRTTWFDRLAVETGMPRNAVHDPDRLVSHVPARERATISACLIELVRLGLVDPLHVQVGALRAPTAASSERAGFEVRVDGVADWRRVRRVARPFLSVLRSLTGDAKSTKDGMTMTIRFGYDPA